jgi:hypothetical protein
MRSVRREEPERRVAAGRLADDRDDVGAQYGAGRRQGMIGCIAAPVRTKAGLPCSGSAQGDDLKEFRPRRHQAVSGL